MKKTMSYKLKAILLAAMPLFFQPLLSFAVNPGSVEGYVSDAETYKSIPGALVELLNTTDSAVVKTGISNESGKYLMNDIAPGKYMVRISGMTYRKYIIPDVDITLQKPVIKYGTTNLTPEAKTLKEVGIFGYKLTGEMEDDKTIYSIKSKSADIAQSGLELLRQLPDVTVDFMSNDVKLAGNSNILFQVNGRKVNHDYLLQLNPKLIDKIEVITNPGVKYDSDVDAVINLILKKDMQYGFSGRLRLEVPTSKTVISRSNGSMDLFFKKVRLYVAGNFGVRRFDMESFSERTTTVGSNTSLLTQNTNSVNTTKSSGFNYGADWFINDNNTLNFYSSVQPTIPNSNSVASDNTYTSGQTLTRNQSSISTSDRNYYYDYSLFYKHKFAKKFHEISFESYLSNKNSNNTNDYFEQAYIAPYTLSPIQSNPRNQLTESDNRQISLKTDYTYPFTEKIKLSIGYNGNFSRATNTYGELISTIHDSIKYNENRHSAYTNISWNVGNLNFQTGIREEFSNVHIIHGYDTTNNYYALLPFASAQYKLGKKHTFRLNYRKSMQRPGVSQLSPMNYKNDSYSQSTGNQKLKPAYVDRLEFTHRIQIMGPIFVSYRPYLSFISNGIRLVTLASTDSILRKKYNNVSNDLEYGVTLSGTLAFVKWWTISPSYTYFERKMQALPQYGLEAQNRTLWRINVSSQFILPKEWVAFVEYSYSSPYTNLQSKSQQNYEFVTGFYKTVNKQFNITAYIVNPWANRYMYDKSESWAVGTTQHSEGWINYTHILNIRLGFNFNKGKEGKKLDRQVQQDEEQETKKGPL
jgi:outer membrane receptor protein involved in Fe transport